MNGIDQIKDLITSCENCGCVGYMPNWVAGTIIDKVISINRMYRFTIDRICSDLKDNLVIEYRDVNYPMIVGAISNYITTSAEEDTVKSTLLYYLNKINSKEELL